MQIALLEMLGDSKNIKLELSPDGSGKGAALIAAIAALPDEGKVEVDGEIESEVVSDAEPAERQKFKGFRTSKIGAVPEFVDETDN